MCQTIVNRESIQSPGRQALSRVDQGTHSCKRLIWIRTPIIATDPGIWNLVLVSNEVAGYDGVIR